MSLENNKNNFKNCLEGRKQEAKEEFVNNFGVSFSKGEMLAATAQEQFDFIFANQITTAQLWLGQGRNFTEYQELIAKAKQENPQFVFSVHLEAPAIDSVSLEITNAKELNETLLAAAEAGCTLATIHPGSIPLEQWEDAGLERQNKVLATLANFYATEIFQVKAAEQTLEIAIENLPAKGATGDWGQEPEELQVLINQTRQCLIQQYNFSEKEATEAVGLTLDVNHALTKAAATERNECLAKWFTVFNQEIKCLHIYTPSDDAAGAGLSEIEGNLELIQNLCEQYQLSPQIFLESKKDLVTTEKIFCKSKERLLR